LFPIWWFDDAFCEGRLLKLIMIDCLISFEQDVMEEKCGSAAICFVSFLPDILDSKADGRNKYLEMLLSVAEKFRRSPYR